MTLQAFTDNFADNSTEAGFQFTFFCDLCREGYKTKFLESKTTKKAGFLKGIAQGISMAASMMGKYNVGYNVERGADILSQRFGGMSPEWQKEHDQAFETAQNEAKEHFHRCPKCKNWACDNDWNEQEGLCVDDAPRQATEVASAKAKKMVKDIEAKAEMTTVFAGEVKSKQTICPKCGKPAGEGKFCSNCGATIGLLKCGKCGAESPAGTRFCGECGGRLG
ncbi:MAG: zinc ribbon domain-containing protein [Candidatus Margulisbacteria bacterium]|nr:zinc ribbon domain-containing protein [Candidatus Margulisiibacteriota bacterium]